MIAGSFLVTILSVRDSSMMVTYDDLCNSPTSSAIDQTYPNFVLLVTRLNQKFKFSGIFQMKDTCCKLFAHFSKIDCPLALHTGHNGTCTSVYILRV